MIRPLAILYTIVESLSRWTSNILLLILFIVILSSVTVRYFAFLDGSLAWSEEFSRFCMIWITMLGCVVAFDRGQHLAISIIPSSTPLWIGRAIRMLIDLLCSLFLVVLAYQSFILAGRTMKQISPALGLPFGFVYLSMGIGALLILIQLTIFVIAPAIRENRMNRVYDA